MCHNYILIDSSESTLVEVLAVGVSHTYIILLQKRTKSLRCYLSHIEDSKATISTFKP